MHGMYHRMNESGTIDVASLVVDPLEGHQRPHWSKLHHLNCVQAGYVVGQSTVRQLL